MTRKKTSFFPFSYFFFFEGGGGKFIVRHMHIMVSRYDIKPNFKETKQKKKKAIGKIESNAVILT